MLSKNSGGLWERQKLDVNDDPYYRLVTAVTAPCVWNFNSRPIVHLVTVLPFLRSIPTVFPVCRQYDTSIVSIYCTLIMLFFQILPKYSAYKSLGLEQVLWRFGGLGLDGPGLGLGLASANFWRSWSWSCLGQFLKVLVLVSSPEGSGLEKKVLALILVLRKRSWWHHWF